MYNKYILEENLSLKPCLNESVFFLLNPQTWNEAFPVSGMVTIPVSYLTNLHVSQLTEATQRNTAQSIRVNLTPVITADLNLDVMDSVNGDITAMGVISVAHWTNQS